MKTQRLEEFCCLMERAAVQDRTAEMAAELAREAEQAGQQDAAEIAWAVMRRCRVHALKLRTLTYRATKSSDCPVRRHRLT